MWKNNKGNKKQTSTSTCSASNGHVEKTIGEKPTIDEDHRQNTKVLRLNYVPQPDEQIMNLTTLDLAHKALEILPESIAQIQTLQNLRLDFNKLKVLPDFVTDLTQLRDLSISNNRLITVPQRIDKCKQLESIHLQNNKLNSLPIWWSGLVGLKSINLGGNYYKQIPRCIQDGMAGLEYLNVSRNKKINLSGPPNSKNLIKFIASHADFVQQFPRWTLSKKYNRLREINFEGSHFGSFELLRERNEQNTCEIINLQSCDLNYEKLNIILKNMRNLEVIEIGNINRRNCNSFQSFPISSFMCPELIVECKIKDVGLSEIPRTIETMTSLKLLDLKGNYISYLPEEICNLNNLEVLIINKNMLIMLPENIGKITNLKILEAAYNNISSMPVSISQLKALEFIDLYSNSIKEPPGELASAFNLRGLDFEYNFFETVDMKLPMSHASLRARMRVYLNLKEKRFIGPQLTAPQNIQSYTESSSSSSTFDETQLLSNEDNSNEENWDIDDNLWSEEFDPWNPPPLPPPVWENYYYYHRTGMTFIPSDIHPPSIRDYFIAARANGTCPKTPEPVPGQFDDAE